MLYTKMKNVVNATEPIQCGNKGSGLQQQRKIINAV